MIDKKEPPAATNSEGIKNKTPNFNHHKDFPQQAIMWDAHKDCIRRFWDNPTPENRMVAQLIAARWKESYLEGVGNDS